ncbi:hypothetical protein H8356DRAFT_993721 [Neocallimastix lanati (nom. inval.)]|nr:hypothetical protein H8356DRAFT_993721 [Neocallimastix sp. JGI-2020a]
MLGNFSKGSRIAFYIPRYEYQRNTQDRPKIQSSEWIKTCKYFIESNEQIRQVQDKNSTSTIVNKEYLTNFLESTIQGKDTNIVLYGNKVEELPLKPDDNFHLRTVTSIVTEAFKIISNLSTSLENEGKKKLSLSLKYYSLISENEVFDLLNNNLDENYRIINIKKNPSKDINASFTSEIYERNWIDHVMDINVKSIDDIINVFKQGFEFFQKSKVINKIREKSYNIPKLIVSLKVKTSFKPNERSLIRKYESLAVLNIIDFTAQDPNLNNDGNNFEIRTILNIINGLKRNLFYSPYLNPPYWSQTQYSPRDCQTLIVLFSEASPTVLDKEINDLLISSNIFSDSKNRMTDTNNSINNNEDLINKKNDSNKSNNTSNENETSIENNKNNNTTTNKKKNNKISITKIKTPEQIDALINNYQKQIKDYFDKDIAKRDYIERLENELESCKKTLNRYTISDSFLRKKFLEMNYNMKMYKEQIDELNQVLNEKNNQILDQNNQILYQQQQIEQSITNQDRSESDIDENKLEIEGFSKSEVLLNINKKSENEELLEKEIQLYKENEKHYVELLEDIELINSLKNNECETNKELIEYYLINLKSKFDIITQDLKSINVLENSKIGNYNEKSTSINKTSILNANEQSSIINNQNDNPISYEIYRLNEILKEKEKENCLLKDKIKKIKSSVPPLPHSTSQIYEKERTTKDSPLKSVHNSNNDIFTSQINRIKELEKILKDVTSERDSNLNKISDLEFSLMKAQALIISNTLNKKEEEKNSSKHNPTNNNNKDEDNDEDEDENMKSNENNDPNIISTQNTSYYLSELSSFIPPSPPSISAFSPPTSPTSIASEEETEPLCLTENIFPNLKKYKKNSRSQTSHSQPYYNIKILNQKFNKPGNRNTLYVCDGIDNMFNNIEDANSRQRISEKLSSLGLDSLKKRNFEKEHRRANSIDCFNIDYHNKPNLELLNKNKSYCFVNHDDAKATKDNSNKDYFIDNNKRNSFYSNEYDNYDDETSSDYLISSHNRNYSLVKDNNNEKDTYIKVPQMVVEYDKSRITIKSEEIEKHIPLNYILHDNKHGHNSNSNSPYQQEKCFNNNKNNSQNVKNATNNNNTNYNSNINSNINMTNPININSNNTNNNNSNNRHSIYITNTYGNYSSYNNYGNYGSPNSANAVSKRHDNHVVQKSKMKSSNSSSRIISSSIHKNEMNYLSSNNINPTIIGYNEVQKSLVDDDNMILNNEILNELNINTTQEINIIETEITNTITSEEEDEDDSISKNESTTSKHESISYSSNSESVINESEKQEFPSYIIKQNDSTKFTYNENYNINQYDLSQSEISSTNSSIKKHSKKTNTKPYNHYLKKSFNNNSKSKRKSINTINNSNNTSRTFNNGKNNSYEGSNINYSSNIKINNSIEKKQKDKKRKIPVEKKIKGNNENVMKMTINESSNPNMKNSTYNDKSFYLINNNMYNDSTYKENKENIGNSNYNQPKKENIERRKEKEETSNLYKLSHRISKIFSSKKNNNNNNSNSSKRLSQISIDTLQSEKNNEHSNFFTPNFFHNESKRNSLAVTDHKRINYMGASDPYNILEKEKFKKEHKHMINCIPKKNIIIS